MTRALANLAVALILGAGLGSCDLLSLLGGDSGGPIEPFPSPAVT